MAFRNPLTSLPADGIIGLIQGSQLAADSIDGMTITGALIRTAANGERIELDAAAGDQLRLYTGVFEGNHGLLRCYWASPYHLLELSGAGAAGSSPQRLSIGGRQSSLIGDRTGYVELIGDTLKLTTPGRLVIITGDATISGGLGLWGHGAPGGQPAAPTTLADVIAILRGCGLSA